MNYCDLVYCCHFITSSEMLGVGEHSRLLRVSKLNPLHEISFPMLTSCLQTLGRLAGPLQRSPPLHWTGFRTSIRQELAVKLTLSYADAVLASSKRSVNKTARRASYLYSVLTIHPGGRTAIGEGTQLLEVRWRRRSDSNRCMEVLQTSPLTTWVRRPRAESQSRTDPIKYHAQESASIEDRRSAASQ